MRNSHLSGISAKNLPLMYYILIVFSFCSCSFDYDQQDGSDSSQPDLVMEDVEYVRVRSGDPIARFHAERAERFESRRTMQVQNFSFQQFEKYVSGVEVSAFGNAGSATIEMDTGNIFMNDGVRVEVESENIIITTNKLEWRDRERHLSAGENEVVNIEQSDGTEIKGIGFLADVGRRTWEFSGGVIGTYIYEDTEDTEDEIKEDNINIEDIENTENKEDDIENIKNTEEAYEDQ